MSLFTLKKKKKADSYMGMNLQSQEEAEQKALEDYKKYMASYSTGGSVYPVGGSGGNGGASLSKNKRLVSLKCDECLQWNNYDAEKFLDNQETFCLTCNTQIKVDDYYKPDSGPF